MRTNDFSCIGFIDSIMEPDFELIDGREIQTIAFDLITKDNLRFPSQTDDRQIAFRKLKGIDRTRLYRCKGYFQDIHGHPVFVVEDLNLSTSVTSAKAKLAKPLPPVAELEKIVEQDTRNLNKAECEALLAHYPENDIRHYALALHMSRTMQMPIPIADNWVQCRRGHVFSVGTPGMLFRNRKTYCENCGHDVSVTLVPKPERTKEQRIADAERSSEALERLKREGWKAGE